MFKTGFGFELSIALKYLGAKRKQGTISLVGFLSVAGVSLGVMALVVVIAVMSGAENDLRRRILGMEPHLILNSAKGPFSDYNSICNKIEKIDNVSDALPYLSGRVMLRSRWGMTGAVIRGINLDSKRQTVRGLSQGKMRNLLLSENSSTRNIIPGSGVAAALGVERGEKLYVLTPDWTISPVGVLPQMTEFTVIETFQSGLHDYDNTVTYMKMEDLQNIMGMNSSVTGIGVYIDDIFKADETAGKIRSAFGSRFWVRTWTEINQSLFSALKLEKAAMFIILTLIILVAAFNIASTLILLVMEKTKEIAIMKTMGATKRRIKRIFVIQGTIIGSLGTFTGVCLGVVTCKILSKYQFIKLPDAYPFTTLPVDLQFTDVLIIAISAVFMCFLSTLYPATQAASLDPVEGIRYGE